MQSTWYIQLNTKAEHFLPSLAQKYPSFYLDGTIFDASVKMTLSCRAVSPDLLAILLRSPTDEEKKNCVRVMSYRSSTNEEKNMPNDLQVWIDNSILAQMGENEEYNHLELVVMSPNFNPPLIYMQLK